MGVLGSRKMPTFVAGSKLLVIRSPTPSSKRSVFSTLNGVHRTQRYIAAAHNGRRGGEAGDDPQIVLQGAVARAADQHLVGAVSQSIEPVRPPEWLPFIDESS